MKSKTFTKTTLILISLVLILNICVLSVEILDKDILISNNQEILKDIRASQEDNYEENDNPWEAYNLSSYEETWLSAIDGLGVQNDYDFYEIRVSAGDQHLQVDLIFSVSGGDIDIEVLNDLYYPVAVNHTMTDNEYIDCIVPTPGSYYFWIYGYDTGNTYNLKWNTTAGTSPPDDNYEENDDYSTATDLTSYEETWLSTINGFGVQYDDDWYEIYVDSGELFLHVELIFTDDDGDLAIDLYASDGSTLITSADSWTDNEYIDYIVPSAGTYFLLIYDYNVGNTYNLWWNDTITPSDDNYEDNDDYTTAYDLSAYENTWLSTIDGFGIQYDDDWYEIYVDPGELFLKVNLTFTHADGDIDIEVYASDGTTFIEGSYGGEDYEYINVKVPSFGTYYLRIFLGNAGNTYDLWWNDTSVSTDDNYEDNDDYTTAYDLSAYENTWLSTIDGFGIQYDDDWYEIYVDPGDEHLMVTLTFTHANGDIDIDIYDSSLNLIDSSWSTTDNEYIDVIVPSSGIYYLLIYYGDAGNEYDLWWDDLSTTDDYYEENDNYSTAYDLSGEKNVWLSTVNGIGVQFDDDWYEITIDLDYERLIVDLTFAHTVDNLDLGIYDSTGTLVIGSTSSTDDEHIDYVLSSSGTYYIRVYGNDIGNEYNLRWNSLLPDDNYEENDDRNTAYNLSAHEDTLLNTIDGFGVQLDDDWYEISIAAGYENVTIILTFVHSTGNIDLALYNNTGNLLTSSTSTTDNEYINYIVSSSGTYFIRVYGDDTGNSYNLIWSSIEYTPPGGGGPTIPGYDLIFLFGVIIAISTLTFRKLTNRKPILK